jgi:acyl-CoA synthetase (AMP-forming)/AMP-acid ligase II
MEFNYADLFEGLADALPDRQALVAQGRRLTYAELDAHANRLAHHLRSAGVGRGEHVGIQLYNGLEYVAAILAALKIRAVPINVNYRYVVDELASLYDDADLVALVYDAEFEDRVAIAAARTGTLRHLITVGGAGTPQGGPEREPGLGTTAVDYDAALAAQPSGRGFPERSADDLYIIYTGGTTGPPRGVMWRHHDLFYAFGGGNPGGPPRANPQEVIDAARETLPRIMLPVAPLMHGAGQMASFITFWHGGTNVYVPRFDAAEVLRTIERERVTMINIVGDAMARPLADELAARGGTTTAGASSGSASVGGTSAGTAATGQGETVARGYDLSSLTIISSTGAILSGAVRRRLGELLPNTLVVDSFGSTESGFAAMGIGGAADGEGLRYQATDERITVLGGDLRPVAAGSGEVGQVARSGPISLGYYKDPDKTARTYVEVDGVRWLLSGDLATIERDGTIAVLGRGSQVINTGGEKVYVEEVEAVLKGHPGVFDALVTGIPDDRYGERVAALVQPGAGEPVPDREDLDRHCRDSLAGYKVPRRYVFVDEVRRTPAGKADYRWARRVAEDADPGTAPKGTR